MYFYFRVPNHCKSCADVTQIEIIDAANLNVDIFVDKYAYSGRPLLVKNVTKKWKAMDSFNFEFIRDLYKGLDDPWSMDPTKCQFFTYKTEGHHHFEKLQVTMPQKYYTKM